MTDEYKENENESNRPAGGEPPEPQLPGEAGQAAENPPPGDKKSPWARPAGRKKPRTRARVLTVVGIALAAVAAVLLALFLVYRSFVRPPSLEQPESQPPEPSESQQAEPEDEEFNGVRPYLTGERKQDFYTFLLVGRDVAGGGLTDTIMLVAYDVPNQALSIMSIPRDTMVNAPWDVKKINSVYNMAGGGEDGIASLKSYVADLVGFEPDFTVTVEWEAVGELVDAIGGVWFDVPFNMYYRDEYQDLFINQPKGYRLLSGDDAMQVVRWRQNNSGVSSGVSESDITRTQIAQDFLTAVVRQCLQIQNVTKIKELANIFTEYVDTELTVGELLWFAEQALVGGLSADDMYLCTMPYTGEYVYSRTIGNHQSYVVPDSDALIETVNQHFNPYLELVTMANLDHMSANSDGSVSSSTGTVRDTQATYPESYWAPPEPEPTETEEPAPSETDAPPESTETTEPLPGETDPMPTDSPPVETGTEPTDPLPSESGTAETPVESETPQETQPAGETGAIPETPSPAPPAETTAPDMTQ